jgi:hypothetical protein
MKAGNYVSWLNDNPFVHKAERVTDNCVVAIEDVSKSKDVKVFTQSWDRGWRLATVMEINENNVYLFVREEDE